jgi:large subunit ribosomal protein L18
MNKTKTQKTTERRVRRHARIRSQVSGTAARPRLSVFRSSTAIYIQVIDDEKAVTIAAADSRKAKGKTPLEKAKETGMEIAKALVAKKITEIVFDRGGFEYKGKVKAIAEGAREGGLKF